MDDGGHDGVREAFVVRYQTQQGQVHGVQLLAEVVADFVHLIRFYLVDDDAYDGHIELPERTKREIEPV